MANESTSRGAAVRFPPPFVPLIALALGLALDRTVGPLPNPFGETVLFVLGVLALAKGLVLMALAFGLFKKTRQDPKPWTAAPELIAEGIYLWTRNPMYVSMGVLQAGVGMLLGSLWVVVLVPATWLTIYFIAIRHEEAYLEHRFGEPYREYMRTVRRWF